MTYQTAAAFRRALETRLVTESAKTGTPLVRLRKLVVFERFLARLTQAYPHDWLLKGGLALQLRMGEHTRARHKIRYFSGHYPLLPDQPTPGGENPRVHQAARQRRKHARQGFGGHTVDRCPYAS